MTFVTSIKITNQDQSIIKKTGEVRSDKYAPEVNPFIKEENILKTRINIFAKYLLQTSELRISNEGTT